MSFWSDAGRMAGDVGASALGIDGPSQGDAQQHAQDEANNRGNSRRDEARNQAKALQQEAHGGYDPAAITKHTNWAGKDHKEIKAIADGLQPSDINTHGEDWVKLGQDLQTSTDQFQHDISSALNGNWTGAAGDAAASAPQGIVSWGKSFGAAIQATGTQAQSVSATADQVKATVPPAKDFSWGSAIMSGVATLPLGGVGAGTSVYAQHQEQQSAKEQAVRIMGTVYTPNYADAGRTMPTFATPTDPTQPPPILPPSPPPVPPPPITPPQVRPHPTGRPPGGTYDPRGRSSTPPPDGHQPSSPGQTVPPQQPPGYYPPNSPPVLTGTRTRAVIRDRRAASSSVRSAPDPVAAVLVGTRPSEQVASAVAATEAAVQAWAAVRRPVAPVVAPVRGPGQAQVQVQGRLRASRRCVRAEWPVPQANPVRPAPVRWEPVVAAERKKRTRSTRRPRTSSTRTTGTRSWETSRPPCRR
jgi:hypothetical protein